MKTFFLLMLVSTLLLGCAPAASAPATGVPDAVSGSLPGMGFGILLDEKMVVQSLDFPARNYDIKVGDKLLDVRPISDIQGVSKEAVPFTDRTALQHLLTLANQAIYDRNKPDSIFAIRLEREGTTREVEITIDFMGDGPDAKATATPAPVEWFYY